MNLFSVVFWLMYYSYISETHSKSEIKIYPTTRYSVVTPPRIMILGCEGKGITRNVTWYIPNNAEFWTNTNFARRVKNKNGKQEVLPKYLSRPKEKYSITYQNITDEKDPTKQNAIALLHIKNFTYNDIGYYYCEYMDHKFQDDERKQIFVFVNDNTRLSFLEKDKTYIINERKSTENLTFPCIPTAPHIHVTLKASSNARPWEGSIIIPKETAAYDSHTGFNFKLADTDFDKFICEFRKGSRTEEIYFEHKYTNFDDYNIAPYVDISTNVIVKTSGEDFGLSCTFATDSHNSSSLIWILPKNFSNVKIYKQSIPLYKGIFHITNITINNLTLENEGVYICKINNTDINGHVVKKYLIVDLGIIDTSISKPQINVSGDLIITSGESIFISCQGNENIIWTYSSTQNSSKIMVLNLENKISKNNNSKILHIIQASYNNTGYYYCHNQNFSFYDSNFSDNFFVFVEDKNNLARSTSDINIQAPQYSTVVIDCVATSPIVNVSLYNYKNEQIEAKYNKHLGFEMYLANDDILNLICKYELGSQNQIQKVVIDVQKTYKYEYIPFLSSPNKYFMFQDSDLELTCSVIVREDFYPDIKWSSPSNPDLLIANNIQSSTISYLISNGKVVVSTLVLKNVKLGDNMQYECSFRDTKNETRIDRRVPFIIEFNLNPVINGESLIAIEDTFFANCTVRVDHNTKFKMTWDIDFNDTRFIMPDTNYDLDVYGKIGKKSLIIRNTTYEDSRNYTCIVIDNKNITKEKSLELSVRDPTIPEIYESNMNNGYITIKSGGRIDILCKINEHIIPKTNLQWYKDGEILKTNVSNNYLKEFVKKNDSGVYTCNATNTIGTVSRWQRIEVKDGESESNFNYFLIIIGILVIAFLLLIIVFVCRLIREKIFQIKLKSAGLVNIEEGQIHNLNPNIFISDQAELLPYDKKWEIPRDRVKIGNKLGSGEYGVVKKGEVFGIFSGETIKTVAIKMLHRNANYLSIKALINELKIMSYIGKHLNVVNLLGACTNNIRKREILIITEYCIHGNLRNYLLKHRDTFINQIDPETGLIDVDNIDPDLYNKVIQCEDELSKSLNPYVNIQNKIDKSKKLYKENNMQDRKKFKETKECKKDEKNIISTHDLLCWAFQISRGMDYLSSRRILHGDLAARNVLLSNNNIVKICDFGLAKNMYKYKNYKKKSEAPLPVKWMAIESLRDRIFSVQSDVWSFGVTLWELFSMARTPYPDIEADSNFIKLLEAGLRMKSPEYATSDISFIMNKCWNEMPSNRPTFPELTVELGSMIHENVRKHYIEMNKPYENLNITEGAPNYLEIIDSGEKKPIEAEVDDYKDEDLDKEFARTEEQHDENNDIYS